jgi:carbamoyl-phosphate synthase large subunit
MTHQQLNILFLGGAKRVSMAEYFIEAGKKQGIEVGIFSYELNHEVPIREVARIIEGKKWADSLPHLKEVISEFQISAVIPFVDPATLIASRLKEEITGLFCPVSQETVCLRFFSKILANNWCLENNIPVPVSVAGRFPKIAKPDTGSASQGIVVLNSEVDLQKLTNPNEFLIQQFIDATEYTVDAYRSLSQGNINYLVPRIRLETQGGEAIKARTVKHSRIEELSREIIEKADLRGAITLQFLEEKGSGEIYFMEVNPRYGGGVVTSYGAGVDIAGLFIADLNGQFIPEKTDWKDGLTMLRRYKEIFI